MAHYVNSEYRGVRDLVEAVGLDPAVPIHSITIRAECGKPVKVIVEKFVTVEQFDRATEVVRRASAPVDPSGPPRHRGHREYQFEYHI